MIPASGVGRDEHAQITAGDAARHQAAPGRTPESWVLRWVEDRRPGHEQADEPQDLGDGRYRELAGTDQRDHVVQPDPPPQAVSMADIASSVVLPVGRGKPLGGATS